MPEQNDKLNRIRNLRKTHPKIDKNHEPPKCSRCLYYQPDFRYRRCLYARCPYGKDEAAVFRKKVLPAEKVTEEVVR